MARAGRPTTHGQEAKVTFYCTEEFALELDRVKLSLREQGVKADRSTVIRAAISLGLDKFEGYPTEFLRAVEESS